MQLNLGSALCRDSGSEGITESQCQGSASSLAGPQVFLSTTSPLLLGERKISPGTSMTQKEKVQCVLGRGGGARAFHPVAPG